MGKTDRIREDFIALIDEYFFNPVDDNFSAREALKSMPKDRQMDAMIRLTHILPKPKQEIDLGIFTKSEMFILGKDGKALDE